MKRDAVLTSYVVAGIFSVTTTWACVFVIFHMYSILLHQACHMVTDLHRTWDLGLESTLPLRGSYSLLPWLRVLVAQWYTQERSWLEFERPGFESKLNLSFRSLCSYITVGTCYSITHNNVTTTVFEYKACPSKNSPWTSCFLFHSLSTFNAKLWQNLQQQSNEKQLHVCNTLPCLVATHTHGNVYMYI